MKLKTVSMIVALCLSDYQSNGALIIDNFESGGLAPPLEVNPNDFDASREVTGLDSADTLFGGRIVRAYVNPNTSGPFALISATHSPDSPDLIDEGLEVASHDSANGFVMLDYRAPTGANYDLTANNALNAFQLTFSSTPSFGSFDSFVYQSSQSTTDWRLDPVPFDGSIRSHLSIIIRSLVQSSHLDSTKLTACSFFLTCLRVKIPLLRCSRFGQFQNRMLLSCCSWD